MLFVWKIPRKQPSLSIEGKYLRISSQKNHDISYLDYRIFPAGVDQSKVGKVFPCLVLKVVHGRIGHHLGIVAMLRIYRDYALSDKNDETH